VERAKLDAGLAVRRTQEHRWGVVKFTPNGTALSPPITGFTAMDIDGVGWGTAVALDKVWITSFNGKILVMDFDGHPIGKESDFPFKEKLTGLMGVGIAANGDVWIADGSGDQLLHFPSGRVKDGRIVKVAGLKSPFEIVIDDQNRVWVANSSSDTVVRFPARWRLSPPETAIEAKLCRRS
jgi:streptogramin lyase